MEKRWAAHLGFVYWLSHSIFSKLNSENATSPVLFWFDVKIKPSSGVFIVEFIESANDIGMEKDSKIVRKNNFNIVLYMIP